MKRLAVNAATIPFRQVVFKDRTSPVSNFCHENVRRYVAENPECSRVCGWLLSCGFIFDKHSIVESGDGSRFDITPLRFETPFLEHPGAEGDFDTECCSQIIISN